jgi:putative peptidoglycan lipid II flippase
MYGRYLVIIPIAIMGQAAGIASYPFLSQLHATGKHGEFASAVAAATKGLMLIMLPVSTLTIVLSRPLICFAFTHTKLTQIDVDSIAAALAVFAFGMAGRGAQCIISRGFNAAQNTLTPALLGTLITFVSLPLYWFCARTWQYVGLAAASSIVAVVFVGMSMILLFRHTHAQNLNGILLCLGKVIFASFIGGLICRGAVNWLESRLPWHTFFGAFLVLVIVTASGFPLILAISRLLGVREVDEYWNKVCSSIPRSFATTRV